MAYRLLMLCLCAESSRVVTYMHWEGAQGPIECLLRSSASRLFFEKITSFLDDDGYWSDFAEVLLHYLETDQGTQNPLRLSSHGISL